jgi:hypothetical protein
MLLLLLFIFSQYVKELRPPLTPPKEGSKRANVDIAGFEPVFYAPVAYPFIPKS